MKLNNHLLLGIIECFEDFLDEKGIKIPNKERDEQSPNGVSNIWGDDFDELMTEIRDRLGEAGVIVEDEWED